MKRALSAAQMRQIDAAAAEHGMPSSVLMENAGAALAQAALELAGAQGRFLVLCGLGNNGGDGLVAARKLAAAGRTVNVELMGLVDVLGGEPQRNFKALKAGGTTVGKIGDDVLVGPGDVVIDALLGIGLSRAPEAKYADAIRRISSWRAAGAKVLAADLPSGLESDLGTAMDPSVTADVTLSFGFLKVGQVLEPGATLCGRLEVVDVGIPRAAHAVLKDPVTYLLEEADVTSRLPVRRPDTHKGTYGHVLVVAGSWGKMGAAALTGLAALRAGAGLVTVATRPKAMVAVLAHGPELMGVELASDGPLGIDDLKALLDAAEGKDAVVFGPGIDRGEDTGTLIRLLLDALTIPCVLDADGLNALAGNLELIKRAKGSLLLTPHPGEMARLTGKTIAAVQRDRIAVVRDVALSTQIVVALKGARTLIAREDGTVFINPTGNAGMASAGTGDVLAGVCGALLAQGLSSEDAAVTGCYAHGLAGDLVLARRGKMGLMASDLLDGLGEVWVRWNR